MPGTEIDTPQTNEDAGGSTFTFHMLPDVKFELDKNKELKESLTKWNLDQHMVMRRFRYDQFFQKKDVDSFLLDFFNDPEVQQNVPLCTGFSAWSPLSKVSMVEKEAVATTLLRLDLFDRLDEEEIVRGEGRHIQKCFDVPVGEGIYASDKLRLMLCDEGSEEWDLFSKTERKELLFHILKRLQIGGGLCQYEDKFGPYQDACKLMYKDLVGVQKNSNTGKLEVASATYQVTALEGCDLFAKQSNQNFCYVTIDPNKRYITYWYHSFLPMMS